MIDCIFIPTRGRPTLAQQKSFALFKLSDTPVKFVVRNRADLPPELIEHGVDVLKIISTAPNLTAYRNAIFQYARKEGLGRIVIADDDVRIYERLASGKSRVISSREQVQRVIKEMDKTLDRYVHCGPILDFMSHTFNGVSFDIGRYLKIAAFDMQRIPARMYFRGVLNSDIDMNLQLTRLGFPGRVLCSFSVADGKYATESKDGGCGIYRTPELEVQEAQNLIQLHPGYVRLHKTSVVVSWAKLRKEILK